MSELRVERDGPLAIVTLARAAKLNALTFAMLDGLAASGRRDRARRRAAGGHPDRRRRARHSAPVPTSPSGVRSVRWTFGRRWIVRGAPGLRPLGAAAPAGDRRCSTASRSAAGWSSPPPPTTASPKPMSRVGLPETQVGIVPGWSGTQRLVRRAGSPAVKRLALIGEPIDAAEALRLGLVDEVVATGAGMAAGEVARRHHGAARAGGAADREAADQRRRGRGSVGRDRRRSPAPWPPGRPTRAREWRPSARSGSPRFRAV